MTTLHVEPRMNICRPGRRMFIRRFGRAGRALAMTPLIMLIAAAPATQPATEATFDPLAANPYEPKWLTPRPPSDPVEPIADDMLGIAGNLQEMQTDAPVQDRQKAVVNSLDVVIKTLEQQCKGGSGGNPNPTTPLGRSIITGGPGGSGPLHDAKAGTRVWGQLPAKDREQITQSQTEGFPPGYESVLSNYYGRLSQEQTAADANAALPSTQPAAR